MTSEQKIAEAKNRMRDALVAGGRFDAVRYKHFVDKAYAIAEVVNRSLNFVEPGGPAPMTDLPSQRIDGRCVAMSFSDMLGIEVELNDVRAMLEQARGVHKQVQEFREKARRNAERLSMIDIARLYEAALTTGDPLLQLVKLLVDEVRHYRGEWHV